MERRSSFITLDAAAIASAIAPVSSGATLLSAAPLNGGASNSCYRVETDAGVLVLRVYGGSKGARVRDKEAALLPTLSELPVPRLLGRCEAGGAPALVLEFLPGRPLATLGHDFDDERWARAGRSLGEALARIHGRSFPVHGDLRGDGSGALRVEAWDFDGGDEDGGVQGYVAHTLANTPAGERLGPERSAALLRCMAIAEAASPARAPTPRLVHGDLNPTNLLVADDGALTGILDWEFAHAGDPAMDLGNLFRRAPTRGAVPPRAFADALSSALELPLGWREAAALVDLSSTIEFLSSTRERPQTFARALRQLDAFIEATERSSCRTDGQ